MPVTRHTSGTLPYINDDGHEEPLPHYSEVLAEHGPKDENGPTWALPDFSTKDYEPWLPGVEEQVEREAAERAPQIADEALRYVRDELPPFEYQLDSDVDDLDPDKYELSWNKRPTEEPIKVPSVRADKPSPSPRAQRLQA